MVADSGQYNDSRLNRKKLCHIVKIKVNLRMPGLTLRNDAPARVTTRGIRSFSRSLAVVPASTFADMDITADVVLLTSGSRVSNFILLNRRRGANFVFK